MGLTVPRNGRYTQLPVGLNTVLPSCVLKSVSEGRRLQLVAVGATPPRPLRGGAVAAGSAASSVAFRHAWLHMGRQRQRQMRQQKETYAHFLCLRQRCVQVARSLSWIEDRFLCKYQWHERTAISCSCTKRTSVPRWDMMGAHAELRISTWHMAVLLDSCSKIATHNALTYVYAVESSVPRAEIPLEFVAQLAKLRGGGRASLEVGAASVRSGAVCAHRPAASATLRCQSQACVSLRRRKHGV